MRVLHAEPHSSDARLLAELDRRAEAGFRALGNGQCEPSALLSAIGPFAELLSVERGYAEDGRAIWLLRALDPSLRPLAERVLSRRPDGCPVEIEQAQPRLPLELALRKVREQCGVDLSRARARAGFARGHLLDVSVFVPGGSGASEEPAARQLVEAVLGEAVARDWVGEVRAAPVPRGVLRVLGNDTDERQFPLSELAPAIDAAIAGLHEGLAAEPWWAMQRELESVVFELEPEPISDGAAQDDVVITSSCMPEMLHCFLRGAAFASVRFTRHGELFAYLKYRPCSHDPELAMEERDALEEELDQALITAHAGRVVGRGLGLSYAYLDLALANTDEAVRCLRRLAEERHLPGESWLLFCDTHLEQEWVSLRPGAPAPPL